jgi:hypothetical protein
MRSMTSPVSVRSASSLSGRGQALEPLAVRTVAEVLESGGLASLCF